MNKDQIREQIACAIAGINPLEIANLTQTLEEGGFYSRADAILSILAEVRGRSREAAIEEVARDYHEAMTAKLHAQAAKHWLFVEATRLRALAETHRSCAKEIREQAWTRPSSENSPGASDLHPGHSEGS